MGVSEGEEVVRGWVSRKEWDESWAKTPILDRGPMGISVSKNMPRPAWARHADVQDGCFSSHRAGRLAKRLRSASSSRYEMQPNGCARHLRYIRREQRALAEQAPPAALHMSCIHAWIAMSSRRMESGSTFDLTRMQARATIQHDQRTEKARHHHWAKGLFLDGSDAGWHRDRREGTLGPAGGCLRRQNITDSRVERLNPLLQSCSCQATTAD